MVNFYWNYIFQYMPPQSAFEPELATKCLQEFRYRSTGIIPCQWSMEFKLQTSVEEVIRRECPGLIVNNRDGFGGAYLYQICSFADRYSKIAYPNMHTWWHPGDEEGDPFDIADGAIDWQSYLNGQPLLFCSNIPEQVDGDSMKWVFDPQNYYLSNEEMARTPNVNLQYAPRVDFYLNHRPIPNDFTERMLQRGIASPTQPTGELAPAIEHWKAKQAWDKYTRRRNQDPTREA
jgi:hypothetical protein